VTKFFSHLCLLATAAVAAGCGGGYGGDAATEPAGATSDGTVVELSGSAFAPRTVDVRAGETVTFVNRDEIAHTATADGTFDSGTIEAGATFSFTAEQTGVISYVCVFHPGMTGTVDVT
jgi:plastocyanin